jgi:hypothetical protein
MVADTQNHGLLRLAKTLPMPPYLKHLTVLDNYTGPINVVKGIRMQGKQESSS